MNVVPKPKKKDYCFEDGFTDWINATSKDGKKMVKINKDEYIDHLERYSEYLELLVQKLESEKLKINS